MKFKEAEARVRGYIDKFKSELPNPTTMEIALYIYSCGLEDGAKGEEIRG